jgi:hypothetical protein
MIISIVPVPAYPTEASNLRVDSGVVILDEGANFQAILLDANQNPVSVPTRVALTPEQYAEWTGDDRFVAQCVAENMGLTPAE